jgi:ribonuclease Z
LRDSDVTAGSVVGTATHLQGYLSDDRLIQVQAEDGVSGEASGKSSTSGSLSVWLTGTGTPAVLPGRSGPSNLVRAGQDVILVDCGNGTAYQLANVGVALKNVTHVFITHHHIDHNVDLPYVLISPWVESLDEEYHPPHIVGPKGTATFIERMFALHEYDLRVRVPHGFDPSKLLPRVTEISDGAAIHGSDWTATAIEVDHHPVDQAYGYRFDAGTDSVAFSGDTRPSPNLISKARGVGTLVHEVLYPGYGIPEYHTLSTDVGKVATEAQAERLVLTHLLPGHLPDHMWIDHVKRDFQGPVLVGSDLLRIL